MSEFEQSLEELKKNNLYLKDKDIVGIAGNFYDITYYIKHHPGGELIKKFIGKECKIHLVSCSN